ncbi:MAG: DUF4268 domain-containing protein [Bacteroidales bacterium]|nr:DUF4268 domain-containing protein [Bacteroidales bacterium]
MFTKEEKKELRVEFWNQFKHYSTGRRNKLGMKGKWMLENTGIRQVNLKFEFNTEFAWSGVAIDTRNLDKRIDLWEKFESLKAILEQECTEHPLIWEFDYKLAGSKSISLIYAKMEDVSVYNKTCWKQVSNFLFNTMLPLERILVEYVDFIKPDNT